MAPLREVAELEQRQRVAARGRRLRAGRQQQRVRECGPRTAKLVWQHIKTARLLPPLSVVCQDGAAWQFLRARQNCTNEGSVQSEQGLKVSKSQLDGVRGRAGGAPSSSSRTSKLRAVCLRSAGRKG